MEIAFGGNPNIEETRLCVIRLIAELLFPESIERDPKLDFIAFFSMV
jgi:hypothetical protein